MRIATWNINSIRIREETLRRFVEQHQPDILCLQETKVTNDQFPLVASLGFSNVLVEGEKSYNGVAILSKFPLQRLDNLSMINQDKRHIAANIPGTNIELHNFYVPAGGDEPDVMINPKFKHKLEYVGAMTAWLKQYKSSNELIILGDLNIAPYEHDVWSHKQLLKVVSHTPQEVEGFNAMKESVGLEDCLRKFYPLDQKLYSWWSYRNHDWQKSNRGRRLDHILVTKPLIDRVTSGVICSERRSDKSPSDHVPVMIELR